MNYGLKNKTVLVTGGSRGIGKATASLFAAEGAHVFITYAHNASEASKTISDISSKDGKATALFLDLNDSASIQQVVNSIEKETGQIDVLVNNAVFWGEESPIEDYDNQKWFSVIDQTVKGTYLITKAAVSLMKKNKWGRLVHVSSSLVQDGKAYNTANIAGKAALHGFNKSLAIELAEYGIYSNIVMPELTMSEWVKDTFPHEVLEIYAASFPTKRLGTPEDVASLIVYLASTENRFVNGEAIRVSGGK